ncbi:MAG: MBL fold metallo-hydrolase [Deltaproteobacteria bacterium]|nr:MBL fold metallo-hydrolase [Deltaproteobacteria bacterium]MBW2362393.1 MBL fold metallo-hydrolase [Deltaproteobacteria bacterium]
MSELVFIGTGDAFGACGRRQSAVLLRAPNGSVLLDCGATTLTGLNELGIDRNEIDGILISHFHGDHIGGIPYLLLAALYEDGRTHPLHVAGPVGTESLVRSLAAAMCYALDEREWSFPVIYTEFVAGQKVDVGPVRCDAFETLHQPNTCPHGMIVHSGHQRVAYSGDTGWFPELPSRVAGADLFICECTYHKRGFGLHLSHDDLLKHGHEFDCGRTVLTHLGEKMREAADNTDFDVADDGTAVEL